MKRLKKFLSSSRLNVAIFAVTVVLILTAAIGGAYATAAYIAQTYGADVSMNDIGVSLVENGNRVSARDYSGAGDMWNETSGALLTHMLDETNEELIYDRYYQEELSVYNSGTIDEYVRVSVYRYWEDANGKKSSRLLPDYIELNFLTGGNGWVMDESSRTSERTVLYYQSVLPTGESTPPFCDTIKINSDVMYTVTEEVTNDSNGYSIYTYTYVYDGARFVVRADVDAVQTHNADDAIRSAWGIEMGDFGIH